MDMIGNLKTKLKKVKLENDFLNKNKFFNQVRRHGVLLWHTNKVGDNLLKLR